MSATWQQALDCSVDEAKAAVEAADIDGDGKVDYEEFLAGQTQLRKWKQKKKPSKHRKSTTAGGEHRHSASPAKDPALRDGQR